MSTIEILGWLMLATNIAMIISCFKVRYGVGIVANPKDKTITISKVKTRAHLFSSVYKTVEDKVHIVMDEKYLRSFLGLSTPDAIPVVFTGEDVKEGYRRLHNAVMDGEPITARAISISRTEDVETATDTYTVTATFNSSAIRQYLTQD